MRCMESALVQCIGPSTSQWAEEMKVTVRRAYEMLSPAQNVHEKWKRAILGALKVNPKGGRVLWADVDALRDDAEGLIKPVTVSDTHRALSKAIQASLDNLSNADQQWCIRMAIATLNSLLRQLQSDDRWNGQASSVRTLEMTREAMGR